MTTTEEGVTGAIEGIGFYTERGYKDRRETRRVCVTSQINQIADLAKDLIGRWGIIAGEIDGEDSAGRAKLRRMKPDELVDHAVETAEKAWKAFAEKGWILSVPLPEQLEEDD